MAEIVYAPGRLLYPQRRFGLHGARFPVCIVLLCDVGRLVVKE